jgi:hypothetical protein
VRGRPGSRREASGVVEVLSPKFTKDHPVEVRVCDVKTFKQLKKRQAEEVRGAGHRSLRTTHLAKVVRATCGGQSCVIHAMYIASASSGKFCHRYRLQDRAQFRPV